MAVNLANKNFEDNKNKEPEKSISIIDRINEFLLKLSSIPLKEKLFFVQHLSIMLKAGISLSASLKTLAKQSDNKLFIKVLLDIAHRVESGQSFTESLKPYEKIFGELFINMIDAGELSGKLEDVLKQLYIQLKKQHELISKVKGAMTYPTVILIAMLGIGVFMMVFIVPKITDMLKSFNAELPLPTKILIGTSAFITGHGIIVLVGLAISIFAVYKILHTRKGKYYFQSGLLALPVFGAIIKKINLARFARTISALLRTDIAIIKSFQITANVLGNLHYKDALNEMAEKIRQGGQINEVITNYPKLFSPIVVQMVAVGEQTGELDTILDELANFYEGEVDQIMTTLPSIIEPILILVMGIGVGGMAVAIIMPMYSLSSAV